MSQRFWLQYAKRHTPQKYSHMECTQNDCYYHMECIFFKKKGEVTLTKATFWPQIFAQSPYRNPNKEKKKKKINGHDLRWEPMYKSNAF